MKDAIVFNGFNSLDFQSIRSNVIRIPQVIQRIRQAQKIWDQSDQPGFDIANFIASEDAVFLSNIKLKSLAAAIVQVGLYDRYCECFSPPQYVVGNGKGDSVVRVIAGEVSFEEMVASSQALKVLRPHQPIQLAEEPVLSGISLAEYKIYRLQAGEKELESQEIDVSEMEFDKLVQYLLDEEEVRKFVNIGPGNLLLDRHHGNLALSDVQVLESIDIDPLLNWFWPSLRESAAYAV